MGTTHSNDALRIGNVSRRFTELFHRVSLSQAIVSSSLDVPRVSEELTQKVRDRHLSGETGIRDILDKYKIIVPIQPGAPVEAEKVLAIVADGLGKQTAINAEMVISAAAVILSHSTADDVFTEVCKLAIDLDPTRWIPLIDLKRTITLQSLKDRGFDSIFEEELQRLKLQLDGKSLPNRADLLFKQVPIRMHPDIPKDDLGYFTMSKLRAADELRHELVHRNGLPRVDLTSGITYSGFLHEAASTALRSVLHAYDIPIDLEYWKSVFGSASFK